MPSAKPSVRKKNAKKKSDLNLEVGTHMLLRFAMSQQQPQSIDSLDAQLPRQGLIGGGQLLKGGQRLHRREQTVQAKVCILHVSSFQADKLEDVVIYPTEKPFLCRTETRVIPFASSGYSLSKCMPIASAVL